MKSNVAEIEKQIKAKNQELLDLKRTHANAKEANSEAVSKIQVNEKNLLEKEFELKEIENEKNVRSQDALLLQILDELKKRCRGYLGQFYELIKPLNKKYETAVKVSLSK